MMGDFNGFGWFGHGFGWLFMVLVWVAVIVGIMALIKWLGSSSSASGETPLEILKARYARGEIDKKEYERMRRELQK
ncbi:MAG: SHOCT domain-containing protein [Gammaproteobacteria bacterium]|nr:SHOCT domain-containing protein [Gammaproteobacteria bacterium]